MEDRRAAISVGCNSVNSFLNTSSVIINSWLLISQATRPFNWTALCSSMYCNSFNTWRTESVDQDRWSNEVSEQFLLFVSQHTSWIAIWTTLPFVTPISTHIHKGLYRKHKKKKKTAVLNAVEQKRVLSEASTWKSVSSVIILLMLLFFACPWFLRDLREIVSLEIKLPEFSLLLLICLFIYFFCKCVCASMQMWMEPSMLWIHVFVLVYILVYTDTYIITAFNLCQAELRNLPSQTV